jgi:hypothetical protein
MSEFDWFGPKKKSKPVNVFVEGPITKKIIKKLKRDKPGRTIIINGKIYIDPDTD